jgi:predicted O-methyltransferase YrrM
MSWFHAVRQRILHLFRAKERHGIHSPLVYQLMEKDLRVDIPPTVEIIEDYRKKLLQVSTEWSPQDHGAGSRLMATKSLATAVKRASSNRKKGAFLYRWAHRFQPSVILELGTHVGIGTGYLHLGQPSAELFTMEGDPFLADQAKSFFASNEWKIKSIIGTFDEQLKIFFSQPRCIDLVILDGHHQKFATLHYLEVIASHVNEGGWVLIDDIHWSKEMTAAWDSIVRDKRYQLTLDFFQYGAVYLGRRNQKEHFILKW